MTGLDDGPVLIEQSVRLPGGTCTRQPVALSTRQRSAPPREVAGRFALIIGPKRLVKGACSGCALFRC